MFTITMRRQVLPQVQVPLLLLGLASCSWSVVCADAAAVGAAASATTESGVFGISSYTVQLLWPDGSNRSFWHEVEWRPRSPASPLEFQMVCEIPRGACAKMETNTGRQMMEGSESASVCFLNNSNPIQQSLIDGWPRYTQYGVYPFNYGMIPQTWEDQLVEDAITGTPGDGDPIDVVELSKEPCEIGSILTITVLGALAMIDDNQTDWKVVGTRKRKTPTDGVRTIETGLQERHAPNSKLSDGEMRDIYEWFRDYKSYNCFVENQTTWTTDIEFRQTIVKEGWGRTCSELYMDIDPATRSERCRRSGIEMRFHDVGQSAKKVSSATIGRPFVSAHAAVGIIKNTHERWEKLVQSGGIASVCP